MPRFRGGGRGLLLEGGPLLREKGGLPHDLWSPGPPRCMELGGSSQSAGIQSPPGHLSSSRPLTPAWVASVLGSSPTPATPAPPRDLVALGALPGFTSRSSPTAPQQAAPQQAARWPLPAPRSSAPPAVSPLLPPSRSASGQLCFWHFPPAWVLRTELCFPALTCGTPNVIAFGDGPLGELGLDEVMKVEPHDGT